MSNGHRWSKFWWQDWQNDPALRMCSLAAQGLWMRLLCVMHEAEPVGHLLVNGRQPSIRQVAALAAAPEKEVALLMRELEEAGVYSRTAEGVIFCRRMVRDAAAAEAGREHVAKRWNGETPNRSPNRPPNRPPNRGATSRPNGKADTPPTGDPNTLEAEAEAEAEGTAVAVPTRARARPKQPLPGDWQPTTREINFGLQYGLQPDDIHHEAERLRDWAAANATLKADWDAFFRNWLRDAVYRHRSQPPATTDDVRRDWGLPTFLGPKPGLLS